MTPADRFVNAVRTAVERALPWFDPAAEDRADKRTEIIVKAADRTADRADRLEIKRATLRRDDALRAGAAAAQSRFQGRR
jgi:hypothetical protein